MSDYLKYVINVDGKKATASINNFKKSLSTLGQKFKETSSSMKRFQTHQTKLNTNFNNINRDGNRTSKVFTSLSSKTNALGSSFNRLNKFINLGILIQLGRVLAGTVNSAVAMTETANLFSVSLGDMTFEADQTISTLSELYGLDTTNLRSSTGTFSLLARSMGMSSEQAKILGTNTTQLAIDLSSLMNVPLEQVMGDLRSGLVGQSETVYKYGIDVTEAGLKAEAMAEGITKSVRNMSQGEKMALRYNVMLKQTGLAHGDFARTIDTPANQMKILNERFTTLSRAIGTIFIPILKTVLPYLNAVVKVLINVANIIASLFGYKGDPLTEGIGGGLNNVTDDADALDDSIGGATDSAKKLKNALMGFDEVNVLPEETDSSSGGSGSGVGGDSILDQIELAQMDAINKAISQQSDAIASSIESMLNRIKNATEPFTNAVKRLWNEGLSLLGGFTFQSLVDFYNEFLVPIGMWAFGTEDKGLTRLINIINEDLKNIDWATINKNLKEFWTAIEPYAEQFGEGFIDFLEDVGDISVTAINSIFGKDGAFSNLVTSLNEGDPESARSWGYALGILATSLLLFPVVSTGLGVFSTAFGIALGLIGNIGTVIGGALGTIGAFGEAIALWSGGAGTLAESFAVMFPNMSGAIGGFSKLGGILSGISATMVVVAVAVGSLVVAMVNSEAVTKAFGDAFSSIKGVISSFWNEILLPLAQLLYDVLSPIISAITEALKYAYDYVIVPLADFIGVIFFKALESIAIIFEETIIPKISTFIEMLSFLADKILIPLIELLKGAFLVTLKVVFTTMGTWITGIQKVFSGLIDFITGVFTGNWELAWSGIKDIFIGIFETLKETLKSIINGLIGMAESFVNAFINGINEIKTAINSLQIVIPDWVPEFGGKTFSANLQMTKTISIPRLAKGGIVDSSRVVNVGESGKEAIVPLENNLGWIDTLSQMIVGRTEGSIGNSTPLDVTFELNGKRFAQATLSDFENEARRQGGLRVKLV